MLSTHQCEHTKRDMFDVELAGCVFPQRVSELPHDFILEFFWLQHFNMSPLAQHVHRKLPHIRERQLQYQAAILLLGDFLLRMPKLS